MEYRIFFLQFLLVAAASCGIDDLGEDVHSNSDGIWYGPSVPDPENVCFSTVFEYPDGYDWRNDSEQDGTRCMLALYAEDTPVLKIPVGSAHAVSAKPERHRVFKGNLYTDYSDSLCTVIKKNGKELFRYPEPETILNMLVAGDDVHTLGVGTGGQGFVYRINGVKVVERNEGTLFNHLDMSRDTVSFCFCCPVTDKDGTRQRYYESSAGKVRQIEIPKLVKKVWDVMIKDGRLCIIAEITGQHALMVSSGAKSRSIQLKKSYSLLSCGFLDTESLCVQAIVDVSGGMRYLLCPERGISVEYEEGRALSAAYVDKSGCYAVINPSSGMSGLIYTGKTAVDMPHGYAVRGVNPVLKRDSVLVVGLSSLEGGSPVLWRGGDIDTLNVNGYITGMSLYR